MQVSSDILAHYLIVITTFERCQQQFSHTIQLNDNSKKAFAASALRDRNNNLLEDNCYSSSPLLQIRWLRIVVDEGHELGATESPTAATLFISEIAAERRWVMSGTPTSAISSRVGLAQLQRLLRFLRHERYGVGVSGVTSWRQEVKDKFTAHDPEAAKVLETLLRTLLVRHSKVPSFAHLLLDNFCAQSDINLHPPVFNTVVLDQMSDERDKGRTDEMARRVDRAIASYIISELQESKARYKEYLRCSLANHNNRLSYLRIEGLSRFSFGASPSKEPDIQRRPKFIVFSENFGLLQGVGHFLYVGLGDQSVCEHYGSYRSTELSRFRHSKKTFRVCPLCGHKNPTHCQMGCERILLRIVYDHVELSGDQSYPPSPGGHGWNGPGGHLTTDCYCSTTESHTCSGYVNILKSGSYDEAVVAEDHIGSYEVGMRDWATGQRVFVTSSPPTDSILWRNGRMGGWATIIEWRRCGGKSHSWHGSRVLSDMPWKVEEEDASILVSINNDCLGDKKNHFYSF